MLRITLGVSFIVGFLILVSSLAVAAQPLAAGDEYWDDRFGCRLAGDIADLTVFQDTLYGVGAVHCGVSSTPQRTLLGFNGRLWTPVQNVQTAPLNVVVGTDTYLYAAGHTDTGEIMRYDGTTVDSLPGIDSPAATSMAVQAMTERAGILYVASVYQTADTGTFLGIFAWDGNSWSHLGDLVEWDASVAVTLEAAASGVYLGGSFSGIGPTAAQNVAIWTGTVWEEAFSGSAPVYDLAVTDASIYTIAQTNTLQRAVYVSQGKEGQELGVIASEDVRISGLGSDVYVHGDIGVIGGVGVGNVARWDEETQTWEGVGEELFTPTYVSAMPGASAFPGEPHRACRACDLVAFDDHLVLGGATALLDTARIYAHSSVWMLYRDEWVALPKESINLQSLQNPTHLALRASEDGVYFGGFFKGVGSSAAVRHAWWDGREWHDWSGGFPVRASDELFTDHRVTQGTLTMIARSASQNYSRLLERTPDGQWHERAFMNSSSALSGHDVLNGEIYVGGSFSEIEGVTAQNFARWDGTTWNAVPTGQPAGIMRSVITNETGVFILRENGATRDLWRLENGTWQQLTTTMAYFSNGLTWWNGNLYHYGGSLVKLVNGSWQQVPGAPSAIISATGGSHSLYMIGDFSFVNGISAARVARWDGTTWASLGSGLPGRPHRIAAWGRNMYVGGEFTQAGLTDSLHLAAWHNPIGTNTVPRTVTDTFLLEWGESIELDLTEYAWDLDYDPLTFSDMTLTAGSVMDLGNGRIRVTAPINTNDPFSLTYTVNDDHGGSTVGHLFFNLVPQYRLYFPRINYVMYQP